MYFFYLVTQKKNYIIDSHINKWSEYFFFFELKHSIIIPSSISVNDTIWYSWGWIKFEDIFLSLMIFWIFFSILDYFTLFKQILSHRQDELGRYVMCFMLQINAIHDEIWWLLLGTWLWLTRQREKRVVFKGLFSVFILDVWIRLMMVDKTN